MGNSSYVLYTLYTISIVNRITWSFQKTQNPKKMHCPRTQKQHGGVWSLVLEHPELPNYSKHRLFGTGPQASGQTSWILRNLQLGWWTSKIAHRRVESWWTWTESKDTQVKSNISWRISNIPENMNHPKHFLLFLFGHSGKISCIF